MRDAWSLRRRRGDDVLPLVHVLREVHEHDGYPGRWPEDPEAWMTPEGLVGAWVVCDRADPLGHVALSTVDPDRPTAAAWAVAAGAEATPLRCVTRLFVAAGIRGTGAGTALLDAAVRCAQQAGARAVLEVARSDAGAVGLYRRQGWQETGRTDLGSGAAPASLLFVAPDVRA